MYKYHYIMYDVIMYFDWFSFIYLSLLRITTRTDEQICESTRSQAYMPVFFFFFWMEKTKQTL